MSAFGSLAEESIRDASRRRIVAAIIALSLVSLMLVDGCTSCAAGNITVNGEVRSLDDISGATGTTLFVFLGLWVIFLAGILGSDHLQQTLEDGSAHLCLARPISRNQFALARLAGALSIAFAAGLLLLGVTAVLLHTRSGLPLGPAAGALLACALGAVTFGSLGMLLSLFLPRMACLLALAGILIVTTLANLQGLMAPGSGGVLFWIDQLAPPFATSIWLALDPWVESISLTSTENGTGGFTWTFVRALFWAGACSAALVAAFGRQEIDS